MEAEKDPDVPVLRVDQDAKADSLAVHDKHATWCCSLDLVAEPKEGRVARESTPQVTPASRQKQSQAQEATAGRRRSIGMEDEPPQEQAAFDCGPWAETPSSTRVASYRFDYHNRAIQVR